MVSLPHGWMVEMYEKEIQYDWFGSIVTDGDHVYVVPEFINIPFEERFDHVDHFHGYYHRPIAQLCRDELDIYDNELVMLSGARGSVFMHRLKKLQQLGRWFVYRRRTSLVLQHKYESRRPSIVDLIVPFLAGRRPQLARRGAGS